MFERLNFSVISSWLRNYLHLNLENCFQIVCFCQSASRDFKPHSATALVALFTFGFYCAFEICFYKNLV